jgi:hypothetical protein
LEGLAWQWSVSSKSGYRFCGSETRQNKKLDHFSMNAEMIQPADSGGFWSKESAGAK